MFPYPVRVEADEAVRLHEKALHHVGDLSSLDRALQLRGDFVPALSAKARAYERLDRSTEARSAWTALAQLAPNAYLQLARFELTQGRTAAAQAALRRAEASLGDRFAGLLERFPDLRALRSS